MFQMTSTVLVNATPVNVTGSNDPINVDARPDLGIQIAVTGAVAGDTISVNIVGGLNSSFMADIPLLNMPLTVTIPVAATEATAIFSLDIRGIPFLQVQTVETDSAGGATVTVSHGGGGVR